jgi:peptide/nickel transport system permease protein
MLRYIIRRLALSLITLFILLVIVFSLTRVFTQTDPARLIAGPFASEPTIEGIRQEIGSDDPYLTQFGRLVRDTITFDFGRSFDLDKPVREIVFPALGRSAFLVVYALVITIPISIIGGLFAGRRKDTVTDRTIVTLGIAGTAIPDFVTAVILQYVIAVRLGWLPALGPDDDENFFGKLHALLLPAITILIVYFGYIARMTRAGTIQAYDSDYVRTAYMKGLNSRQVIRRHVLRNALQPTVAVVGTQFGYLFGGLVALEFVFNYKGLGLQILNAALKGDLPVLTAGVILVAIIFMAATLTADLIIAWMNPRARLSGGS